MWYQATEARQQWLTEANVQIYWLGRTITGMTVAFMRPCQLSNLHITILSWFQRNNFKLFQILQNFMYIINDFASEQLRQIMVPKPMAHLYAFEDNFNTW